ncbi:SgcJ/EcaC family oxidoreductase [Histidinibacterium aquaticum]|uniref:SgcJ/EcaC family oxidoreductase n=2 Tax=Histidinibacterium aquaticum TaxID=2613962 RepID=A0A5J5GL45_9RHOB|nr:SgcJ/EcaC family oxidoreductase [Histidinibacterium aquaticum]
MARDAAALAALFAEDADFVNVVGLWWEDRPAIGAAHHRGLTTFFAESRLALGRVKVRHLGETAVVHARLRLSGQTAPDGSVAEGRSTILVFVMAKQAKGWHCVAAQNTDIVPGAETHLAGGGRLSTARYD